MEPLATWGALAAALLALECFVIMLVVGAIVFGLKFGMDWVLKNTSRGLQMANEYLLQGQALLERYQSIVAAPLVRIRAARHGIQRGYRAFTDRK